MTIEIHRPEKPLVVEKISPDWIVAAQFFMRSSTIGPDRSVLLSQEGHRSCFLKTAQNPKTNNIDTVGRIEIREDNEVVEVVDLNADKPIYICATQTPNGVEVEQIIKYRPFRI